MVVLALGCYDGDSSNVQARKCLMAGRLFRCGTLAQTRLHQKYPLPFLPTVLTLHKPTDPIPLPLRTHNVQPSRPKLTLPRRPRHNPWALAS